MKNLLCMLLFATAQLGAKINFGAEQSMISLGVNSLWTVGNSMVVDRGTFKNSGFGKIEGADIRFKRGIYNFFNAVTNLDASVKPEFNVIKLGDSPEADGDTMISNPGGLSGVQILVAPGINILRGQPLFFGANDLLFQDSNALLAVAVQNTLNTNITLNGGLLFLQDDLRLGDDAVILDNGQVVFNKRRFSLGGKSAEWNGNILWDSAQDLQLNSAVTLNGLWGFIGDGQINGNGNVLDIRNGGQIVVFDDSTLRLSGVQLKGLGSGAITLYPTARLILTDVDIEMDTDYAVDSGTWFVEGNSTVIVRDKILTFKQNDFDELINGKLIVDRVTFTYDTQAFLDGRNIRPSLIEDPEGRYVQILGNGEIRTIRGDTLTFRNYKSGSLLQKYAIVAPYRKFEVYPELLDDQSLNYDVLIDGNTNFLGFTRSYDEPVFIIKENVHATTKRVILRDVSPAHFGYEPNSSLIFGDQTTITLARNEVLNSRWVFEGETILRGAGMILELGPEGEIVLQGQDSQLLLDGITLKGLNGTNLRCTSESGKIIMKAVRWFQSGDFNFEKGSIQLLDDVTMSGPTQFTFTSNGMFQILSYATLYLNRGFSFNFAPSDQNVTNFTFQSTLAALQLEQASFGGDNGLRLSNGRLIVRSFNQAIGKVSLDTSMILDRPVGAIFPTT